MGWAGSLNYYGLLHLDSFESVRLHRDEDLVLLVGLKSTSRYSEWILTLLLEDWQLIVDRQIPVETEAIHRDWIELHRRHLHVEKVVFCARNENLGWLDNLKLRSLDVKPSNLNWPILFSSGVLSVLVSHFNPECLWLLKADPTNDCYLPWNFQIRRVYPSAVKIQFLRASPLVFKLDLLIQIVVLLNMRHCIQHNTLSLKSRCRLC